MSATSGVKCNEVMTPRRASARQQQLNKAKAEVASKAQAASVSSIAKAPQTMVERYQQPLQEKPPVYLAHPFVHTYASMGHNNGEPPYKKRKMYDGGGQVTHWQPNAGPPMMPMYGPNGAWVSYLPAPVATPVYYSYYPAYQPAPLPIAAPAPQPATVVRPAPVPLPAPVAHYRAHRGPAPAPASLAETLYQLVPHRSRARRRPPPPAKKLPTAAPAKLVTLPHVSFPSTSTPGVDPLVSYQTLSSLLSDLNKLLRTPHVGREFEFRGTCANIVGAGAKAPPSEAKLRERAVSVGWEIIEGSVLAFDVHALGGKVVSSSRAAVVATQSAAIWMGGGVPREVGPPSASGENGKDEDERPCPCTHCEHLLTITITLEERNWPGWYGGAVIGERVVIGLRHFAN
ncbi:hypothetical protein MVEN_00170300 [Mycena venus]|uniref:Uncharacterized protein n=1 Tax=Mycena venus TaxID=2733690 RepID=A0A8H7DED8_9AGAR|nr:hypothetical protein MVEN_00170300 [Mycena venus]